MIASMGHPSVDKQPPQLLELTPAQQAQLAARQQAAELQAVSTSDKACQLLQDCRVTVTLGALLVANAAISCLESTLGYYLEHELGMSPGQVYQPSRCSVSLSEPPQA